jgi:hypothetical protein
VNKRILLILLLLLTVLFSIPFWLKKEKNKELKIEKIEVIDEYIVGTRPVRKAKQIRSKYAIALDNMNKDMREIDPLCGKEWLIAYKDIVSKYSYIIDPPEALYDYFTDEELDLLFHVVQAEVGDEYSFEQKVNVANVIFNRMRHIRFPDDLFEILTAEQFQTIADGKYMEVEVSDNTILACEYAFMFPDTTNGSLFFDSNNTLKYEFVVNDGAHNFYKLKGEDRNE